MCEIRVVDAGDLSQYYSLFTESVNFDYPSWSSDIKTAYLHYYSRNRFEEVFRAGSHRGYLALDEDDPVGFISFSQPELGVSNCEWLGVKLSYRRRGIARQLLAKWERYARNNECHGLSLICEEHNVEFHQNMRFTQCGFIPRFCLGLDFYFFFKKIAEVSFNQQEN